MSIHLNQFEYEGLKFEFRTTYNQIDLLYNDFPVAHMKSDGMGDDLRNAEGIMEIINGCITGERLVFAGTHCWDEYVGWIPNWRYEGL